jgi:hypothetical protein
LNTDKKPSPFRRIFVLIGGAALLLLFLVLLCYPVPLISDAASVIYLRSHLPSARDTWAASAPSAYRVHVKGAVPLACLIDAELVVHNGELTKVLARENPLLPDTPLKLVNENDWQTLGCSFEDLTIEGIFQRIDDQLRDAGLFGLPLTVKFDKQLGYITEYRFGRASQGGLFGAKKSECCTWFEYDRFVELPP